MGDAPAAEVPATMAPGVSAHGVGGAHDDERGQGLTEYSLILILIAVVVILVVGLLGHQVNNLFSNVSSGFSG